MFGKTMNWFWSLEIVCALLVAFAVTGSASAAQLDCAAITAESLQLPNVQITKAELVTHDSRYPAYCLLQGNVNERTGIDGHAYAIGFEMRLPSAWNGRFLHQVNGGNDGAVVSAEGVPNNVNAAGSISALARGFAVLSTDAGHNGSDPANADAGLAAGNMFGLDPQARADYGYTANDTMAPIAKQIIAQYYGQDPAYTYMFGCSNGGLSALMTWVEAGDAPDQLLASVAPANPEIPADWSKDRTRTLCVWPRIAKYVGGDPERAESFQCELP